MNSFLNFLKRNKLYALINLLGLTVSMAFVLLLAVYVQRQLSTDAFQKNADRIYVITNEESVNMGYWLDKHLRGQFPEIEKSTCVANVSMASEYKIDSETVYGNTIAVDSCFFEMFSYDLVKGSKDDWRIAEALVNKNKMIRTGLGYDVHRLVPERKLILGGVLIEDSPLGLLGHSDADLLSVAISSRSSTAHMMST